MRKKKNKFVYLVYCNKDPIVYGVYGSKQNAVRYALDLIRYRRDKALREKKTFGYYHFSPLPQLSIIQWMKDNNSPYYYDPTIFSACLNIPEDKNADFGDDGCTIKVVRRTIND